MKNIQDRSNRKRKICECGKMMPTFKMPSTKGARWCSWKITRSHFYFKTL